MSSITSPESLFLRVIHDYVITDVTQPIPLIPIFQFYLLNYSPSQQYPKQPQFSFPPPLQQYNKLAPKFPTQYQFPYQIHFNSIFIIRLNLVSMRSASRSRSPGRDQPAKSKKLYIANLPQTVNNADLTTLFQEFGEITDIFIRNKDTFSFGFVEFVSISQAEKALKAMNRTDFKGREIKVNYSKPRPPRNEEGGAGGGGNRGFQRNEGGDGDGRYNKDRSRSRENDFKSGRGGAGGGGGGGDRPKGCFNCGENGHFSRECPEPKKPRDNFNGQRRDFNGGNRGGDRPGGNRNGGGGRQENPHRNTRSPVDRGSPVRNSRPAEDVDY